MRAELSHLMMRQSVQPSKVSGSEFVESIVRRTRGYVVNGLSLAWLTVDLQDERVHERRNGTQIIEDQQKPNAHENSGGRRWRRAVLRIRQCIHSRSRPRCPAAQNSS